MNRTSANSTNRDNQGFSLVEVVLAIAIVAVGLVAILGLFPQGLKSARNAADDSLVAVIAQDVITRRKIDIATGTASIGTSPGRSYFMADGAETNSANANLAMFRCEVTCIAVAGIPKLETTEVLIIWPWFKSDLPLASYAPLNTNIFATQIAAYQ